MNEVSSERKVSPKVSPKAEEPKKRLRFSFGKRKVKNVDKSAPTEEKKSEGTSLDEESEISEPEIRSFSDYDVECNKKGDVVKGDDEDMQFALHKSIVRMTSTIQDQGAGDDAYNEYMEEFKARCIKLQPDRLDVIKRESANFTVTLRQSEDDPSKKVVVYGSGVDYMTKRFYLKDNAGA